MKGSRRRPKGHPVKRDLFRRVKDTPFESLALKAHACPVCARPREEFKRKDATCCCPAHSQYYWWVQRPTWAQLRLDVFQEQNGRCARCGQHIDLGWDEKAQRFIDYILDHIVPIALGGDQWARENLQALCESCNKTKTAKDLGQIARYKKSGRVIQERGQQGKLLPE